MRYCGIVTGGGYLHLCAIEEVRDPDPPIRLRATFYEPGSAEQVAAAVRSFDDAVVGIGAPLSAPRDGRDMRVADQELRRRGVFPLPYDEAGRRIAEALAGRGLFGPDEHDATEGSVTDGAYTDMPVFETSADGVFCALHGQRVPAKRHPLGIQAPRQARCRCRLAGRAVAARRPDRL